jgi:adenylate kinase
LYDDEIIKIVDKVLTSLPDNEEVILDGFPRTIPQAEWLLEQTKNGHLQPLKFAFHLEASRDAVKERLKKRGRIDDVDAAIEARFDEYERSTLPLIKWLADHGIKVIGVDATRSVEAVNADLAKALETN